MASVGGWGDLSPDPHSWSHHWGFLTWCRENHSTGSQAHVASPEQLSAAPSGQWQPGAWHRPAAPGGGVGSCPKDLESVRVSWCY